MHVCRPALNIIQECVSIENTSKALLSMLHILFMHNCIFTGLNEVINKPIRFENCSQ